MAFCKYCGKQLNEGVACNCREISQDNVVNQQQEPANEQQQGGYQGQPQMDSQKPNPQVEMAKAHANEAKNVFINAIKNPYTAMEDILAQNKYIPGIIIGVVHLLLLFLGTTINIPLLGDFLESGDRVKIAFYFVIAVAVPLIIFALVGSLLGKKSDSNTSFLKSLGVFGTATVPGSIIFAACFIMGLISPTVAALLLLGVYLAWILTSIEAMNVVAKGNKNINLWIVIGVHLVCITLLVLVGKSIVQKLLDDAMSSLGVWGSLLGL